ncbi:ComF family protein [candidate division WOR-3 bacterium]|nr:ComF family protein [candidate division WOR-3 bacterium]
MISFSDILKAGFDFILPHTCIICSEELERGMICDNCLEYLPLVNPPLCPACGRPAANAAHCTFCRDRDALDHGRAWMLFVPPSDAVIHHFKYRRKTRLAHLLGRAMAGIVKADFVLSQSDVVASIPLFWLKKIRRGYNQSAILAQIISTETGIEHRDLLKRIRNTRTQTRLSEEHRRQNVLNAFAVCGDGVQDKKILLIDDVLTTGATLKECYRVLKQAGAAEVYSCVAAITPDRSHAPSRHRPATSLRHRPACLSASGGTGRSRQVNLRPGFPG